MIRPLILEPGDPMPAFEPGRLAPPLDAATRARHAPDRHVLIVAPDGTLRARASAWWNRVPIAAGGRIGAVGHYAAEDAGAGHAVLDIACALLREAGCHTAVGPMDGNTWREYRLIVDRGVEGPFFLEPHHPDEWPRHFSSAGFDPIATYTSALVDDLGTPDPRMASALARFRRDGISIRSFDLSAADQDLRRIFRLSRRSFSGNLMYAPIDEEEFLERQRRLLSLVRPDLVLLAERAGELVGFLLAVPDLLRRGVNGDTDTVVIKTVAVLPGRAQQGLGAVLVAEAHGRGARLGFRRAIHALMHDRNTSRNISRRYARTFRRVRAVRPVASV